MRSLFLPRLDGSTARSAAIRCGMCQGLMCGQSGPTHNGYFRDGKKRSFSPVTERYEFRLAGFWHLAKSIILHDIKTTERAFSYVTHPIAG
jgi:hypothetical protein